MIHLGFAALAVRHESSPGTLNCVDFLYSVAHLRVELLEDAVDVSASIFIERVRSISS